MTRHWLLAVLLASSSAVSAGGDSAFARQNVVHFLETSDVTAWVRISGFAKEQGIRDAFTGEVGYVRYKVTGEVLELFRGGRRGPVTFYVVQEHPSEPPLAGEYIVSLNTVAGSLEFADDSVWWVKATPELPSAARAAR